MKVAIIQDGPVFNNLKQTIEKTGDLISQAHQEKADLIVFGECWFSGYPIWLDVCQDVSIWDHKPIKDVWSAMYNNSINIEKGDLKVIRQQLSETNMYAVIGANEVTTVGKGHSTIYNSIITISSSGDIVNHHRKVMPTYTEKLVHGPGDGHGLNAIETEHGRLGSLICWEHWMPMTRQVMHDEAEDLHIALWPYAKELHQLASRHYAVEGRCNVIAVGQIMEKSELPVGLELSQVISDKSTLLMKGGCAAYAPSGDIILEPQYGNRDIYYVDLDLTKNIAERMNLSTSGHYQRHDLYKYEVDKGRTS
jgi:predicted amidohydrolase